MRRTLTLVLLAAVGLAVVPFRVVPASAATATNSWVGTIEGTRYADSNGRRELRATIRFGGYRTDVVAVATYDCFGDFVAATLDCARIPDVKMNSTKFPAALHSDNFAFDDVSFAYRARFESGRRLQCYVVDGPSIELPGSQSARWQVAGACTAEL